MDNKQIKEVNKIIESNTPSNGSRAAKIKATNSDNLTYTRIEAVKNVALFLVLPRYQWRN